MLIQIGEKTYPMVQPDRLSLLDLLMLERQTRELGRPLSMAVIQGIERDIAKACEGLTAKEAERVREEHPDSQWLLGVLLWGAQRAAGEQVTFSEALSFPLSDLAFITEPGDDPEEEAGPTSALAASAQGDEPRPNPKPNKTSKRQSSAA